MKIKLFLIGLLVISGNLFAQQTVSFAGVKIEIPENYKLVSETEVGNSEYSVQWTNVPRILYENDVHKQMIKKMEDDMHARFLSGINFKVLGVALVGKLYQLNVKEGIRFKIISSGEINNQPLILSFGFAKRPKQNSDLDAFMRQFIAFEK